MNFLSKNIQALEDRYPKLAEEVQNVPLSKKFDTYSSKNGMPTLKSKKNNTWIHSSYNPVKEGNRYFQYVQKNTYACILGIGLGYHIKPLLQKENIRLILIEKDISLFHLTLQLIPLHEIIYSKYCHLFINPNPHKLHEFILHDYLPFFHESVSILRFVPITTLYTTDFLQYQQAIKNAIRQQQTDEIVMKRFGKQWTRNILFNLLRIRKDYFHPSKKALLLAAGPSLEKQKPEIMQWRDHLVAVDSTLPFLYHHNINPYITVSIDCQIYGALHYLGNRSHTVKALSFYQLSSYCPSFLKKAQFFIGNHPLEILLAYEGLNIPTIPLTGGNVSTAAFLLLRSLGYKEIKPIGNDFSYPHKQPYLRGTYFYQFPYHFSSRLHTLYTYSLAYALEEQIHAHQPTRMEKYKKSFRLAQQLFLPEWQKSSRVFLPKSWLQQYRSKLQQKKSEATKVHDLFFLSIYPLAIWMGNKQELNNREQKIIAAIEYTSNLISDLLSR